tara:strand:- start:824 stop:1348 length:525 start_codon:yes stop_codon:yes gene_type:complete
MKKSNLTEPYDIDELRAISHRLGSDITLIQGAGGNTSVKDGHVLWVKASGKWLVNAESQDIMVPVDLPVVQNILKAGGSDFNEATLTGILRPSIETSLHCQMNQHVVIHVHSVNAIAWNVQLGAKKRLQKLLSGIDWRYIPYAQPGAPLTSQIARAYSNQRIILTSKAALYHDS